MNTIKRHSYIEPKMIKFSLTMLLIITLFSAIPIQAHKGATGIIKERMDMMGKIGDNMKAIKAMLKSRQPYVDDEVVRHAESVHKASLKIKHSFPEGSLNHPSEALPSIWSNWKEFSSLADKLTIESEKLKEIASTQDQKTVMQQFLQVGKTCRSCHTDFRNEK